MSEETGKKNRVVIVTGASSGIGAATARAFFDNGDTVYGLSRRAEAPVGVIAVPCDVTDEDSVLAAVRRVLGEAGRIDVLVNNAGFGISGAAEFTLEAAMKKQFDVNFFGMVRCTKAVLPIMRAQGAGRILNLSSVAAALPIPFQAFYSAVKAAVSAFSLALQNEVRPYGICVCALLPGDVKTGFTGAREKSEAGADVYSAMARSVAGMERDEQGGMAPAVIGKRLVCISKKKRPKGLYSCGLQYQFFLFLGRVLPVRLSNWIVGKMYA